VASDSGVQLKESKAALTKAFMSSPASLMVSRTLSQPESTYKKKSLALKVAARVGSTKRDKKMAILRSDCEYELRVKESSGILSIQCL
jgi:hypothetical protein